VEALEYHAYEAMAEEQLRAIGRELTERHGVTHWLLAHRLGLLAIGEVSMVVAVASPHREEAFAACRWAVERIKSAVPIWKKEYFIDGAHWVGLEESSSPHS
jgi:molybdopterin synthase catalytic subunit